MNIILYKQNNQWSREKENGNDLFFDGNIEEKVFILPENFKISNDRNQKSCIFDGDMNKYSIITEKDGEPVLYNELKEKIKLKEFVKSIEIKVDVKNEKQKGYIPKKINNEWEIW